jgi:hypothetical protein
VDATWWPHRSPPGRAMPRGNYFIRIIADVFDDGVPPKCQAAMVSSDVATLESRFATVASDMDCDGAMTWVATSATFWVVWGSRVCSF